MSARLSATVTRRRSALVARFVPARLEALVPVRARRDRVALLYVHLLAAVGAVEVPGLLRLLTRVGGHRPLLSLRRRPPALPRPGRWTPARGGCGPGLPLARAADPPGWSSRCRAPRPDLHGCIPRAGTRVRGVLGHVQALSPSGDDATTTSCGAAMTDAVHPMRCTGSPGCPRTLLFLEQAGSGATFVRPPVGRTGGRSRPGHARRR